VTEAEWLDARDPESMLYFERGRLSDRKSRLFACACCRRLWLFAPDRDWQRAVETAERYADGSETPDVLRAVRLRDYRSEPEYNPLWSLWPAVGSAVHPVASALGTALGVRVAVYNQALRGPTGARAAFERRGKEQSAQTELIRDIAGNPFRRAPTVDAAWLTWHGGVLRELAQAAYENRLLPEGTLDPARLSLLADALEDAGCTDGELLGHLRGPGPHVRGCWAVDLVLGKE
jgi:hypothetical protein